MFCHITENWRGRPLVSRTVLVNLIGNTKTRIGLTIQAELDEHTYPTGLKVSDEALAAVRMKRDKFHGDWNYMIRLIPFPLNTCASCSKAYCRVLGCHYRLHSYLSDLV